MSIILATWPAHCNFCFFTIFHYILNPCHAYSTSFLSSLCQMHNVLYLFECVGLFYIHTYNSLKEYVDVYILSSRMDAIQRKNNCKRYLRTCTHLTFNVSAIWKVPCFLYSYMEKRYVCGPSGFLIITITFSPMPDGALFWNWSCFFALRKTLSGGSSEANGPSNRQYGEMLQTWCNL